MMLPTIKQVSIYDLFQYCREHGMHIWITPKSDVRMGREGELIASVHNSAAGLHEQIASAGYGFHPEQNQFPVPGYESLAQVLQLAYEQAASGKGHERHANELPFDEQPMQDGADAFGVGSLLFQAYKKSRESQGLPHAAKQRELLGAINYLAGAYIANERHFARLTPANQSYGEAANNG